MLGVSAELPFAICKLFNVFHNRLSCIIGTLSTSSFTPYAVTATLSLHTTKRSETTITKWNLQTP